MSIADWPYAEDGVKRDEFAESLRLPLVNTDHPYWQYVTAVVVHDDRSDGFWLYRGVRPTDDELRAVALGFHAEYVDYWYTPHWRERMRERPFDIDGGAVGRYLVKDPEKGWGYRKSTWIHGPRFGDTPLDVFGAFDRFHGVGTEWASKRWTEWKSAHPDLFLAVSS